MTRWRKVRKSARGVYEPDLSEEQILRIIVEETWLRYRIKLHRINCAVGGKVRPNERGLPDLFGHFQRQRIESHDVSGHGIIRFNWMETIPLYIEVKKPGGRRRPEQVQFIAEAKANGCAAFFAESWEDVDLELKAFRV